MSRGVPPEAFPPMRRVCPDCGQSKLWKDFFPARRWEDGTVRSVRPYCRPCSKRRASEWRERNKERDNERRREAYKRRMADEETREQQRERWREEQRKLRLRREYRERDNARSRDYYRRHLQDDPEWHEYNRKRVRAYKRHRRAELRKERGGRLPIEPFRVWLRDFMDAERQETRNETESPDDVAYARIAQVLGISEHAAKRAYRRWMRESNHILIDHADALLTNLDTPARLYELWPELEVAA